MEEKIFITNPEGKLENVEVLEKLMKEAADKLKRVEGLEEKNVEKE